MIKNSLINFKQINWCMVASFFYCLYVKMQSQHRNSVRNCSFHFRSCWATNSAPVDILRNRGMVNLFSPTKLTVSHSTQPNPIYNISHPLGNSKRDIVSTRCFNLIKAAGHESYSRNASFIFETFNENKQSEIERRLTLLNRWFQR